MREWHEIYGEQGLVVIGNHYPEFSYERDLDNLTEAVKELEISYPIAQDNDGRTWHAYQTRYWSTLFLINEQGNIRYTHRGEDAYSEIEAVIQARLVEP